MITYKIMEKADKPNCFKTLFHGINGTRTVPIGKWLDATIKPVKDGSGGTVYNSGIHVLDTYDDAVSYLKNFSDITNKEIVVCEARGIRLKRHSKHKVLLCDKIKILCSVIKYGG